MLVDEWKVRRAYHLEELFRYFRLLHRDTPLTGPTTVKPCKELSLEDGIHPINDPKGEILLGSMTQENLYQWLLAKINAGENFLDPAVDVGRFIAWFNFNRDVKVRNSWNQLANLAVLCGGSAVPGINSAVQAATMFLHNFSFSGGAGWYPRMIGIRGGFEGLINVVESLDRQGAQELVRLNRIIEKGSGNDQDESLTLLTPQSICRIHSDHDCILGSSYRSRWRGNVLPGSMQASVPRPDLTIAGLKSLYGSISQTFAKLGIEGLLVLGGDRSAHVVQDFHQATGFPVLLIPATITNDTHPASERAIGFDSAVASITRTITTALSPSELEPTITIIEVSGCHYGDLALYASLACSADFALLPEVFAGYQNDNFFIAGDVTTKDLAARILNRLREKSTVVIMMSEGLRFNSGERCNSSAGLIDALRTMVDASVSITVKRLFEEQYAGPPSANDHILAQCMACKAVEEMLTLDWPLPSSARRLQNLLVAYSDSKIDLQDISLVPRFNLEG